MRQPARDRFKAEAEHKRKARQSERRRSRAQRRRQKLRAAATLFAAGKTQVEVARELGKNVRTIRRWQKLAGFEAELAKAKLRHEHAAEREQRQAERRRERNARRRLARSDPHRYALRYGVASSEIGRSGCSSISCATSSTAFESRILRASLRRGDDHPSSEKRLRA